MPISKTNKNKPVIFDEIKNFIEGFSEDTNDYVLTEEQKTILEDATEKYYSGKESSFSWDEVKANARKNYDGKKAEIYFSCKY